jgi:hypothetical protein
MRLLLATTNAVRTTPIFVILMMEVLRSSETAVFTRARQRNIPEGGILRDSFTFYFHPENIYSARCVQITLIRML